MCMLLPHRFGILVAGCDLNSCSSNPARFVQMAEITPGRFQQMASVRVGTDTDYSVRSPPFI